MGSSASRAPRKAEVGLTYGAQDKKFVRHRLIFATSSIFEICGFLILMILRGVWNKRQGLPSISQTLADEPVLSILFVLFFQLFAISSTYTISAWIRSADITKTLENCQKEYSKRRKPIQDDSDQVKEKKQKKCCGRPTILALSNLSYILLFATGIQLTFLILIAPVNLNDFPYQHMFIAGMVLISSIVREFLALLFRWNMNRNCLLPEQHLGHGKTYTNVVLGSNLFFWISMVVCGTTYAGILMVQGSVVELNTPIAESEEIFFFFVVFLRAYTVFDVHPDIKEPCSCDTASCPMHKDISDSDSVSTSGGGSGKEGNMTGLTKRRKGKGEAISQESFRRLL